MDLRYFFLNAHYRSKQNFTWEALSAAQSARKHLIQLVEYLKKDPKQNTVVSEPSKKFIEQFKELIGNDFQIPTALALTWDILKSSDPLVQNDKLALILRFDEIFGLKLNDVVESKSIPREILDLAEERKNAKINKDFAKADELRKKIEGKGYEIKDTKDGYSIK